MATEFCQKLTEHLNKQGINVKIALPSETKWEYACRAGTTTRYWFGDDNNQLKKHAWYDENSGYQTHSVIEKEDTHTNSWDLVDMHGNVWEWCADSWTNVPDLPKNSEAYINIFHSYKPLRGGSWYDPSIDCAAGCRKINDADSYYYKNSRRLAAVHFYGNNGFRVVCV